MAKTTLQLGFVPKERGNYVSGTNYYKDNIVQYNGSSYIADPVGWSENDPTATYVTIAPTDASGNLNAGWRIFASGNNTFTTGQKVGDVGIDNEPTAGSDNLVKSDGVANAIIKMEGSVGEQTTTKIVTSSDYVNLIWDGNKVASSSSAFNGIIIPIHKDVEYSITGTILSVLLFDHYPQINDTTYIESWGQVFTDKKSESDGFLLISFSTANSISIKTNAFGLIKNVSENTLELRTLNLTVGQGYKKTITSLDYVNLLWDGTKVVVSSSNNKAFVVKIDAGFYYKNTGSILSAILFDHYPKVNDTSYIESWGQVINKKLANNDGYLLVSFNTSNTIIFEKLNGGVSKNLDTLNLLYDKVNVSEYNFVTTANTRLSKFISISEGTYVIRLVQKSGKLINYNLYITDNSYGTNPIIIKQNAIFDNFVDVSIPNGYKYIWLFNSSENLPAGNYTCYIYNNDSYSELLDKSLSVSLYGKRMVCLGDSITAFSDSDNKQYSDYINYFAGSLAVSGGIGGTRAVPRANVVGVPQTLEDAWATLDLENLVSAWISDSWGNVDAASEIIHSSGAAGVNQDKDILNLKNTPIQSVNIVTIMIGTNDYTGNVQISDIKTSLKNTINAIMAANKGVEIYLFTPTVRYVNADSPEERTDANWCDNWQNTNGDTLSDICDAIIEVSKECHIPCIDIYHNLGWNQSNFSAYFNNGDSTHPYKGFGVLGKKIFKYLKSR